MLHPQVDQGIKMQHKTTDQAKEGSVTQKSSPLLSVSLLCVDTEQHREAADDN